MTHKFIKDKRFLQRLKALNFNVEDNWLIIDEKVKNTKELNLSQARISNLSGIEYFTSLEKLDCSGNHLRKIKFRKNVKLQEIDCSHNSISLIDLTQNKELVVLKCFDNYLKAINLKNNPKLEFFLGKENPLEIYKLNEKTKINSQFEIII